MDGFVGFDYDRHGRFNWQWRSVGVLWIDGNTITTKHGAHWGGTFTVNGDTLTITYNDGEVTQYQRFTDEFRADMEVRSAIRDQERQERQEREAREREQRRQQDEAIWLGAIDLYSRALRWTWTESSRTADTAVQAHMAGLEAEWSARDAALLSAEQFVRNAPAGHSVDWSNPGRVICRAGCC
jgi:hypothetical protein